LHVAHIPRIHLTDMVTLPIVLSPSLLRLLVISHHD
jgi:hypothetical protein